MAEPKVQGPDASDPPRLVWQVGSTTLLRDARNHRMRGIRS